MHGAQSLQAGRTELEIIRGKVLLEISLFHHCLCAFLLVSYARCKEVTFLRAS